VTSRLLPTRALLAGPRFAAHPLVKIERYRPDYVVARPAMLADLAPTVRSLAGPPDPPNLDRQASTLELSWNWMSGIGPTPPTFAVQKVGRHQDTPRPWSQGQPDPEQTCLV
jgi:hypothetical protein